MTKKDSRINISMIMYGGLSYGGAHRQVIRLACALDKSLFNITYFWCKPNQDLHSTFVWPELDYSNIQLMEEHGISVVEFNCRTRDISNKYHPWIDTDFFKKYAEVKTDIVFSSRSGHAEFPFVFLKEPVIEWNIFGFHDLSRNLVYSVAISDWAYKQRNLGQNISNSEIIYPAVPGPGNKSCMRSDLGIEEGTLVFGFHQREDDHIYGTHTLAAYAKFLKNATEETKFIIVGGSKKYKEQAKNLGLDVIFLPILKKYEDVSSFLKTINIFAHSGGAGEAHGTVIQEAMMHGLPSITMRIPGRADGQVGTMAGSGIVTNSIDEYADAMTSLVQDEELRKELSNKAKEHANSKYTIDAVSSHFEEIIIKIHKNNNRRKFSRFNIVMFDYFLEKYHLSKIINIFLPTQIKHKIKRAIEEISKF